MTAPKYLTQQGSWGSLRVPIGPLSAGDSPGSFSGSQYTFGWHRRQTGRRVSNVCTVRKTHYLQYRGNQSQPLPAIPGSLQPTRARGLVAREKGQEKTCSTARSRQGGSRRNALLVDCFGTVSRRPQLRHGFSAMSPGLRNVAKAFHMCSPVILHAAMAQTESGGLVML
jgi:hypothetical protein